MNGTDDRLQHATEYLKLSAISIIGLVLNSIEVVIFARSDMRSRSSNILLSISVASLLKNTTDIAWTVANEFRDSSELSAWTFFVINVSASIVVVLICYLQSVLSYERARCVLNCFWQPSVKQNVILAIPNASDVWLHDSC